MQYQPGQQPRSGMQQFTLNSQQQSANTIPSGNTQMHQTAMHTASQANAFRMQAMSTQMPNYNGQMQQFPGHVQMMPNMQRMPVGFQAQHQFMPMQGMPPSRAPPAYDPRMKQEFIAKQEKMQREQLKMMERQKKKLEEELKHRQFQETQKRLKDFSKIGGRKMDVDTAIHSIIGSRAPDTRSAQAHVSSAAGSHMIPGNVTNQQQVMFQQHQLQQQQQQHYLRTQQPQPNMVQYSQNMMTPNQQGQAGVAPHQQMQAMTPQYQAHIISSASQPITMQQPQQQQSVMSSQQQQPVMTSQQQVQYVQPTQDDDFDDFKSAPVNQFSASSHAPSAPVSQQTVNNTAAVNQSSTANQDEDDFADFQVAPKVSASHNPTVSTSANENAPTKDAPPPAPVDKSNDLMNMMKKFTDFSTANEPRKLKFKPSVKDIHVTQHKAEVFQPSTRARQWSYSEQEQLSDLFTLPTAVETDQNAAHVGHEAPTSQHPIAAGQTSPRQPYIPAPVMAPAQQHFAPQPLTSQHHSPSAPPLQYQATSVSQPGVAGTIRPAATNTPHTTSVAGQHVATLNPTVTGQGQGHARWFEEGHTGPLPHVYGLVLEACTREGHIDTHLLYPILLRSGLDRQVLGALWSLCNRQTPGQLARHEFVQLLAMLAVAQNKMKYDSLDILSSCSHPPIPNLGQHASEGVAPTPKQPTENQAVTHVNQEAATPTQVVNQAMPPKADDEFADFKAFDEAGKADDFSEFKQASPTIPSAASASDLIGQGDKYDALRLDTSVPAVASVTTQDQSTASSAEIGQSTEEFADFASFSHSGASEMTSPAQLSTNNAALSIPPPAGLTSSANQHATAVSSFAKPTGALFELSNQKPATVNKADDDEFGDFVSKPVTAAGSVVNVKPEVSTVMKTNPVDNKLSALKALVSDQKLYSEKPKISNVLASSENDQSDVSKVQDGAPAAIDDGDDWDPFVKSSATEGKMADATKTEVGFTSFSAFGVKTSAVESSASKPAESDDIGGNWAAFAAAAPKVTQPKAQQETFSAFSKSASLPPVETTKVMTSLPSDSIESGAARMTVDPKKAYGIFAHNNVTSMNPTGSLVGLSALDTEPPEFPEFPDDDDTSRAENDDDDFDKFGTFQTHHDYDSSNVGGASEGISSLVTPYGGFDDVTETMTSAASVAVKGTTSGASLSDAQSTSSLEFTGWFSKAKVLQEDAQSTKSLELKQTTVPSNQGSPNNADSQSVASLDFAADSKKKSPDPDSKSVASAELKLDVKAAVLQPAPATIKPRQGQELLTQGGEAPQFGDRYGALFEHEQQDDEKHVYAWEKCLRQSKAMIQRANETLNNISNMEVLKEVMESQKGSEYLRCITEVYRVSCRIKTAMQGLSLNTSSLDSLQREVHNAWNNLVSFMTSTEIMPSASSLSFKKALRKESPDNSNNVLCGVCLLDVNVPYDEALTNDKAHHKLSYGGHEYHTTCANFWVNCVEHTLPALKVPQLI